MWFNNLFPWMSIEDNRTRKKLAKFENDIEFQNTYVNLLNIALYSIKFEGLPDTCNERFFKLNLLLNGMAGLIKDPDKGFLTLAVAPETIDTKIYGNMYGEWDHVIATGWGGYVATYTNYMEGANNTDAQCVICRDNDLCYPLSFYIMMFAKRLTDTMRTLDVAARKLKTPYFITCEESQRYSIQKILEDVDFNNDSIVTNKTTMPDMFQVLSTNLNPSVLRELWNHYNNLDSAVRTLLGVKSALNQDKSERLLVDEVNADNDLANINIGFRLASWNHFCEIVNDLWGLNVSCKINKEVLGNEEISRGGDKSGGQDMD